MTILRRTTLTGGEGEFIPPPPRQPSIRGPVLENPNPPPEPTVIPSPLSAPVEQLPAIEPVPVPVPVLEPAPIPTLEPTPIPTLELPPAPQSLPKYIPPILPPAPASVKRSSSVIFSKSVTPYINPYVSRKPKRTLLIFVIAGSFIGILMLILGLYILLRSPKYKNKLDATITRAYCTPGTSICVIDIKYEINTITYIQTNIPVKKLFTPGTTIPIQYNNNNPNNFILSEPKWIKPFVGGGLTALSFIILIATWWYYIMRKNKT
jgi:hypothetical protein